MKIKGQLEYQRFKEGQSLTRKEAMLALCYECNGMEDSRCDCMGYSCPIYQYAPYRELSCMWEKAPLIRSVA